MKRKRAFAVPLVILALLACLPGCSDYALSQSQLDERLAEAREDGYSEGYDAGRNEAEDEHYNDYDNGYRDGYDRGRADTEDEYKRLAEDSYEHGYEDGVSDGTSFDADSVWQEGYQYGYNRGVSESGASGTSYSYAQSPNEPTDANAMPQPEIQQEPQTSAASYDYIINTNTGKFHYTWCNSVSKMNESNKWYYTGTRDSIINMGYVPCKNCNP